MTAVAQISEIAAPPASAPGCLCRAHTCGLVHLVDPKTGKTAGESNE
jgi:hypothetical protein